MAKILLADDDEELIQVLRGWLEPDHNNIEAVHDGLHACELLKTSEYDLVVLDVCMPGMSGLDVLKKFRANQGMTPVLILTGRDSVDDVEKGFEAGADDYLRKPFHGKELASRVKALLRRPHTLVGSVLSCGDIVFDIESFRVTRNGEEISLLPKEYALLEFFMRNPNKVFTAEALLNRVWHLDSDATIDAVTTCISRLRQKIDSDPSHSLIRTMRGVGYKLENR